MPLEPSSATTALMSLRRRFNDEPYPRQELDLLAKVVPHLRRAVRLALTRSGAGIGG